MDDPEFLTLMRMQEQQTEIGTDFFVFEFLPFLKYVLRGRYAKVVHAVVGANDIVREKYMQHLKSYDGNVRDFCDALIFAKFEAEEESKDTVQQLTDDNLTLCVQDFFAAGTDTTRFTLQWLILFLAHYTECQEKIRREVNVVVADDTAGPGHRKGLNYTSAFIAEVMRLRPVVPTGGIPHKAIVDTQVAGHRIKKGTVVNLHIESIMTDPRYWSEPEAFKPERFLDEKGQFVGRVPAFVSFSTGRRACPGEKLALADLTYIMCRLLQATRGHVWELVGTPDLNGDPEITTTFATGSYEVRLRKS